MNVMINQLDLIDIHRTLNNNWRIPVFLTDGTFLKTSTSWIIRPQQKHCSVGFYDFYQLAELFLLLYRLKCQGPPWCNLTCSIFFKLLYIISNLPQSLMFSQMLNKVFLCPSFHKPPLERNLKLPILSRFPGSPSQRSSLSHTDASRTCFSLLKSLKFPTLQIQWKLN